jgi:hypothetical protein
MNANIKEKFKAILYYMLVILAVHITGCRSNSGTIEDGGDNTSVLTPPSSVAGVVDTITKIDVSWSNTSFPELEKVILEYKKATQIILQKLMLPKQQTTPLKVWNQILIIRFV